MDPTGARHTEGARSESGLFVCGVNAEKYPGLVRRIVNEGHEIGNHTYYHPNLAICWPEHIRLELNATQLLLETITGARPLFFVRPMPPIRVRRRWPISRPSGLRNEMNYLVVLENIDPQDWARPGEDVILQRIKQQRRDGSIILLHDAGGDREQTIEALPKIIDWLQTRGDTIVPLSTLLGISRDAVMPPVGDVQRLSRLVSSAGFPRFSRDGRISLGVHDRRDRVDRPAHADRYLSRAPDFAPCPRRRRVLRRRSAS